MSKETTYEKLKTKFKCLDDYRRELMGLVAEIECDIIELQPDPTGTARECTCNIKSKELAGICNYCYPRSKWTTGECICTHRMLPDPDCPLHGWVTIFKGQKAAYDRLHKTPDLPLNVRVAKDLRKIADALEKGETNEGN